MKQSYRSGLLLVSMIISLYGNVWGRQLPNQQKGQEVLARSSNSAPDESTRQQDQVVTGTILAAEGNLPLAGVSILLKGTTKGTVTDVNGKYTIEASSGDILVFSFIGYITQEIEVGSQTVIDVVMQDDLQHLQELVVVGYGTQEKRDLTGSVASIDRESFETMPIVSADQTLQGLVAGVQVTQNTGAPGGAVNIRIRGAGSINANNEPLYVVDGFPIDNTNVSFNGSGDGFTNGQSANPLSSIDPNDIESIEVLKDASATAIYGSRGSNGVVIITTKRGRQGDTRINFSNYYGWQTPIRTLDLMNGEQYYDLVRESFANDGANIPPDIQAFLDNPRHETDWQDEIFRTSPIQNHSLSVTGGGNDISYAVSGNYFKQEGTIINSGFERYSFRANLDKMALNDRLKISNSLTVSGSVNDGINTNAENGAVVFNAYAFDPNLSTRDAEGNHTTQFNLGNMFNPVSNAQVLREDAMKRILGNISAEYEITEALSAKVLVGADLLTNVTREYWPRQGSIIGERDNGRAAQATTNVSSYLVEGTINYKKYLGTDHSLNLLAGVTAQQFVSDNAAIGTSDFETDAYEFFNLDAGGRVQFAQTDYQKSTLNSFLFRANYAFMDKYLLTTTMRADGSSKFGENNKYGYFPSVSLAWRASDEDFIKNLGIFDDLKFRASYGQVGNQEIPPYLTVARLDGADYAIDGENFGKVFFQDNLANQSLQWETAEQLNIGVDLSLLDNRVIATADYYVKTNRDLLYNPNINSTAGYGRLWRNLGSIENRGFEFSVNTVNIDKAFKWSTTANITFNQNEVIDLGMEQGVPIDTIATGTGFAPGGQPGRIIVGQPLGVFWGFQTNGLFRNEAEVQAHSMNGEPIQPNAQPGDIRIVDRNGDGAITDEDRQMLGNGQPDFFYGIINNFSYKNFDLSIFLQGVGGNQILNYDRYYLYESPDGARNMHVDAVNRWSESNPDGTLPRATRSGVLPELTDRIIEDGDLLRLRNVTLGYNIKNGGEGFVRNMRIYVTAQNLLTITNYSGFDPEVDALGNGDRNGRANVTQGIDFGGYPQSRVFMIGFNVGL